MTALEHNKRKEREYPGRRGNKVPGTNSARGSLATELMRRSTNVCLRLGFFFPLFILFILAGLANAPVSISSGPAEMRCVKKNETQKHSQLILWKCIRRIARWRIGSITLSTTRSFFSVWKRQRRFYLFLAWFLCSGSAIQEMSLPWSNLPTRNCAAVQSSIRDCRKEYPPGVSNQLQRRIMVKKGERKEMERNGKRI